MKAYARTRTWRVAAVVLLAAVCGGVRGAGAAAADEPPAPEAAVPEAAEAAAAGGETGDAKPEPETPSPTPAVAPIDPQVLARWVTELDDDRYGVREAAQKQLAAGGLAALAAVGEAAAHGSLESSSRAVNILLRWADGNDPVLGLAALEQLSALEGRPTESAMANERLAIVREAAAVEEIKRLGGRFDLDRTPTGIRAGINAPIQVIVGPKWQGGVEGLRHVAAVRNATTLSLYCAPLDDSAVDGLTLVRNVRRLELYGTELSDEAVAKLQQRLPQTEIEVRRGGARLGVRGLECVEVVPDSPAYKAGVKPNDKIVEFAGAAIDKFEQLTEEIAKCKPGDSVKLKVVRVNPQTGVAEPVEMTVKFDRWGDDERPSSGLLPGQEPFGAPFNGGQPPPILIPLRR